jgi:hypothetical protein
LSQAKLLSEFSPQSVAISGVHRQQFFELPQEVACVAGIVTIAFHVRHDRALTANLYFASGNMAFGLGQVSFEHGLVHR